MSKSCCLKTVTFLRTIKHASEREYPKMNFNVEPSFAILVGHKNVWQQNEKSTCLSFVLC